MTRRPWRSLIGWGGGPAVAVLVWLLFWSRLLEPLELKTYDLRFIFRGPLTPHPDIVIVAIDEESAQRLKTRILDWPRSLHGRLIRALHAAGARLIVYDLHFTSPSSDPREDQALAAALEEARDGKSGLYQVILPHFLDQTGRQIRPLPIFQERLLGEGFTNIVLDEDGILRRLPVLMVTRERGPEEFSLALFLETARQVAGAEEMDPFAERDVLRLGPWRIPTRQGMMDINFVGGAGSFPIIPFWEVVTGRAPSERFLGKVVFVGNLHPSFRDYHLTPFIRPRTEVSVGVHLKRATATPGVEINASALQTVLERRFIGRWPPLWALAYLVPVGFLTGLSLIRFSPFLIPGLLILGASLLAIGGGSQWLFAARGLWVEVVPLFLTVLGSFVVGLVLHRAQALAQRREVVKVFGRYVSPQVVKRLVSQPELVELKGREAYLTVLFSDIRGFTSMSETMEPAEVSALLNEYLGAMTRVIFEHGGTLDKFMGDAVMAFWGDPIPQSDHALRAVQAALAMRTKTDELAAQWQRQGRRSISAGMGINTGRVVVGNLGSSDFIDYTVVGDEVNLACRLEQVARAGQILLSEATLKEVEGKAIVKALDPVTVKGKAEPIPVWELIGLAEGRT